MKVKVHLHTILQKQTPQGTVNKLVVELSEGSTLLDLLKHLEIRMSTDSLILAINGRVADKDQILVDDDVVNLMPAISGG